MATNCVDMHTLFGLIVGSLLIVSVWAQSQVDVPKVQARYRQLTCEISSERIGATVRWLSSLGSRVAGYEGDTRASEYIDQQFRQIGLQNVQREPFSVTVPIDRGAFLTEGAPLCAGAQSGPH